MKLCAVALDYIARDGRAHPLVLGAVKEAQTRGIVVILVTGRVLADVQRVLPEHQLFDAIVAENGAVLAFPKTPMRRLTHPPSQVLLDELCAREVAVGFGECIIEADAAAAPKILGAIRKLELPLVLQFNHGRVMVLPQGIDPEGDDAPPSRSGTPGSSDNLNLSVDSRTSLGA